MVTDAYPALNAEQLTAIDDILDAYLDGFLDAWERDNLILCITLWGDGGIF